MNVAIIGAGNVGSGLAAGLVTAGHRVVVTGRTPEDASQVATSIGAATAPNAASAAALADVIVLAVPFDAVEAIAAEIRPVSNGKVVVDVTNPAKADGSGPLFEGSSSGAERLAAWMPEAHVVKAFNTVFASNLGQPVRDGVILDGYVAGDDAGAKGEVLELAADLGFHPIDVGPLRSARFLEALAWLNIALNVGNGWPWQTGWKLIGAPASVAPRHVLAA